MCYSFVINGEVKSSLKLPPCIGNLTKISGLVVTRLTLCNIHTLKMMLSQTPFGLQHLKLWTKYALIACYV